MPDCDLKLTNARLATMVPGSDALGRIDNGVIGIRGDRLAVIADSTAALSLQARSEIDLQGRWVTPGLIDCHTHLVFAGHRADEFEQRLEGASYEAIAAAGGGIMSTVRQTRNADEDALFSAATGRLDLLAGEGVTTVEIKSGYGLETASELKMLRVVRMLGERPDVTAVTSFLGAHTVPADWHGTKDAYIDRVIQEMLPAAHEAGLVNAVDAYCESIAFDASQVRRLYEAAAALGLPIRLHADQLSDGGGAALAAEFGALSADHLEYASEDGVRALAEAGTVAVLLPGAFLTLRETVQPPVAALRENGVPIAIATDCNPGTSPHCSLLATMHLASALFRLTPAECLAGVTRNAASALGLSSDRGTLEPGKRADLLAWDFDHPAELCYWLGRHRPSLRIVGGVEV